MRLCRLLLTPLATAVQLATVVVVVANTATTSQTTTPRGNEASARSAGLRMATSMVLEAVNRSADPCADFFAYACGGWVAAHPIPTYRSRYSITTHLREQVTLDMRDLLESNTTSPIRLVNGIKKYYKLCVDTDSLERTKGLPVLELAKKLVGWPLLQDDAFRLSANYSLTQFLIDVAAERQTAPIISFSVSPDTKNTTRRLFVLNPGGVTYGRNSRSYYVGNNQTYWLAHLAEYYQNKTRLFARDANITLDEERLKRDVQAIVEFEQALVKAHRPPEESRHPDVFYNPFRPSNLSLLSQQIDLVALIRGILTPIDGLLDEFTEEHFLLVSDVNYVRQLDALISKTAPEVVVNFMMLRASASWRMQLSADYELLIHNFNRQLSGQQEQTPRWKQCTDLLLHEMIWPASLLYVSHHFKEETKAMMNEMTDSLLSAFLVMLRDNDWMDTDTKTKAEEKARAMGRQIAYPDWIYNETQLNEKYQGLNLDGAKSWLEAVAIYTRWARMDTLRDVARPVDRNDFTIAAQTVNAYYSRTQHVIKLPAGIIQPPFFHPDWPAVMNYGGMGAVLGHELTHAFDDRGSQHDSSGRVSDWWRPDTRMRFEARARCIIDQYNAFEMEGTHANGLLSQGENIADTGGLKEAFLAYRSRQNGVPEEPVPPGLEEFTPEQLFYISYALSWCASERAEDVQHTLAVEEHLPSRLRVNGAVANQIHFAEAFRCPSTNATRCEIW